MTLLAEATARFRAETSDFEAGTTRMRAGLDGVAEGGRGLETAIGAAGTAITATFGVMADKIIDVTTRYNTFNQQAMITFSALEGGDDAARAQIASLDNLSVHLRQNREDLGGAAKYLQIMTEGAGNNTKSLTALSDTAAGLAVPVSDLAQRFGFLFEQLSTGGNNSAYAARSLERMGAITRDQVNELQNMAKSGSSVDQMWTTLIGDLDKWRGSSEKLGNTWAGVKNAMHDVFEIDFGRAFTPLFTSLNKVLVSMQDLMETSAFRGFSERVSKEVGGAATAIDHLAERIANFAKNVSIGDVDTFIGKLGKLAPLLGTVLGLLSQDTASLLARLPIIGEFLTPLAKVLDGGIGGLVGFLLASKETREALLNLIGAILDFVTALSSAAGPVTTLLQALTPVAATVINIIAAIVEFIAQTGPLMSIAKALTEIYLVMKLISTIQNVFSAIGSRIMGLVAAHTTAAAAAQAQAVAETALTGALAGQAAAAGSAAVANLAVARNEGMRAVGVIPVQSGQQILSEVEDMQAVAATRTGWTGISNAISGAQGKVTSFAEAHAGALQAGLMAVTALVIGWNLVTDAIKKGEDAGAKTASKWEELNVTKTSTSDFDAMARRADELAAENHRQVEINDRAGGWDLGFMRLGGDVGKLRESAGAAKEANNAYKETIAIRNKMSETIGVLSVQYGVEVSKIKEVAKAHGVDLAGSLDDVKVKFAEAANAAGLSVRAINNWSGAIDQAKSKADDFANKVADNFKFDFSKFLGKSLEEMNTLWTDASARADDVTKATKGISDATRGVADAQKNVADQTHSIEEAQSGVNKAREDLARFSPGQQGYDEAQKKVADATDKVTQALESQKTAEQKVADAKDKVTEAQKLLNKAQSEKGGFVEEFARQTKAAQDFVNNYKILIAKGLDPAQLDVLFQEGPQKAGGILSAMVQHYSDGFKQMFNDSAKAMNDIQQQALATARLGSVMETLTKQAYGEGGTADMQARVRKMASEFGTATQIEGILGANPSAQIGDIAKQLAKSPEEIKAVMDDFNQKFQTGADAAAQWAQSLGISADAVKQNGPLVNGAFAQVTSGITTAGDHLRAAIQGNADAIGELNGAFADAKEKLFLQSFNSAPTGANWATNAKDTFGAIPGLTLAMGNIVHYGQGGMNEDHVAEIMKPSSTIRVWAEPETGGEAYIPYALAKRGRSTGILNQVAHDFGYGLVKMDSGGMANVSAQATPIPQMTGQSSPQPSQVEYSRHSHFEFAGAIIQVPDTDKFTKDMERQARLRELSGSV